MPAEPPVDTDEYSRWRAESENARAAARVQAEAGLHNWACFAAEQAAQLAVKALLHGLGRGPWGHDLVRLGGLVQEAGIDVPAKIDDTLRRLSRHYIPARYPDAHPGGPAGAHYGAGDADQALADAEAVFTFVDRSWEAIHG